MASVATEQGKSLVAQSMDAVKAHIRESGLRVGDTLPGEGFFADKLGVSRAVMREAFGALAALRLIDVANGRRAKVGALDGSVIADSLEHALSTAQIRVAEVWTSAAPSKCVPPRSPRATPRRCRRRGSSRG